MSEKHYHGFANSPTYVAWRKILHSIAKGKARQSYCVCHLYDQRWKDFINFFEDFGQIKEGESIFRLNNQQKWEKSNCFVAQKKPFGVKNVEQKQKETN